MTPRAALRAAMLSGLLVSAAGGAGVAAAGRGDPALRDPVLRAQDRAEGRD
jgi:hypothetical protein